MKPKKKIQRRGVSRRDKFKQERRRYLWAYKKTRGCQCCREKHVACLEFHHRDESTKSFNVMIGGLSVSMETLQAELAKCDVLCANCHKKLHYREKSGIWRTRVAVYDDAEGVWKGGRKDAWALERERVRKTRRPLSTEESESPTVDPELLM